MFRKTLLLILIVLLFTTPAHATGGKVIEFLLSGLSTIYAGTLNGGSVYTYAAGTTTPKAIYSDQELTTAYDNPATLDTDGRLVAYGSGMYKFIIKDSSGNTIFTADDVEVSSVEETIGDTTDPFGETLTQTNLIVENLTNSDAQIDTLTVTGSATISTLSMDDNQINDVASGTADTDAVNVEQLNDVIDMIYWEASGTTELVASRSLVVDGGGTFTGDLAGEKAGVFACLSTPASVTATVADTWYPIPGTFTNNPMEGFSLAADSIQYDLDTPRYFMVTMHCSVESDIASTQFYIGIKVNGVIQSCSIMNTFAKNANEAYNLSSVYVLELEDGDQVQLVGKCDQAGAVITVDAFTTSIKEFFD